MTIFCRCGGSSGPLLMFARNLAISFFLGYLFDRASFYASEPAHGSHSACAAVELSPTCSCSSSFGNEPAGEKDRSGFTMRSLLTIAAPIALGFSLGGLVGVSVLCCRRPQPHGVAHRAKLVDEWWTDLLPGDFLGVDYVDDEVSHERLPCGPRQKLSCADPDSGLSRAWPFPRVGQRPRGRRRLYVFRHRIADESLPTRRCRSLLSPTALSFGWLCEGLTRLRPRRGTAVAGRDERLEA